MPAVDNTLVNMSPYGQSVFADAIDAVQAVDVAFDSLINEVDDRRGNPILRPCVIVISYLDVERFTDILFGIDLLVLGKVTFMALCFGHPIISMPTR